jgi:hypothetical protein
VAVVVAVAVKEHIVVPRAVVAVLVLVRVAVQVALGVTLEQLVLVDAIVGVMPKEEAVAVGVFSLGLAVTKVIEALIIMLAVAVLAAVAVRIVTT